MDHSEITNDVELHRRIMKLNYLKEEQELEIKRNVKELVFSIHPSVILKNIAEKFTGDHKEGVEDLKSIGLNLGKEYLTMRLFGKGKSIKSFLTSLLFKKAADYVINNHP